MAIEDIFRALQEQAERDIEEVVAEAHAHATAIMEEARAEASDSHARYLENAERAARTRSAQSMNAARLETRKRLAGVKEVANYVLSLSGSPHDAALAEAGKAKFAACAACHGAEAKGNPALGAPNLTDKDWMYGSTLEDIKYGINNGRAAQMPAHLPLIGETQVRLAAAYVYSLSQAGK